MTCGERCRLRNCTVINRGRSVVIGVILNRVFECKCVFEIRGECFCSSFKCVNLFYYFCCRDALATTLSALYGKLLVVMGTAFPMAEVISTYIPPSFYEVYYLYLYIGSMFFLLYMYIMLFRDKRQRDKEAAKQASKLLITRFSINFKLLYSTSTNTTKFVLPPGLLYLHLNKTRIQVLTYCARCGDVYSFYITPLGAKQVQRHPTQNPLINTKSVPFVFSQVKRSHVKAFPMTAEKRAIEIPVKPVPKPIAPKYTDPGGDQRPTINNNTTEAFTFEWEQSVIINSTLPSKYLMTNT